MSHKNEHRIGDELPGPERYLRASSRAVPLMGAGAIEAAYMPVVHEDAVSELCKALLRSEETARAERFAYARDRHEYTQRRAFQRLCAALATASRSALAEFDWAHDAKGRPELRENPEINFSFSSCALGILGAWSKTHRPGVDIEPLNAELNVTAMGEHHFTAREKQTLARCPDSTRQTLFFRMWRIKEAALKAIGEGLPFGLDRFEVSVEPRPRFTAVPEAYGNPRDFKIFEIPGLPAGAALVSHKTSTNAHRPISAK